MSRNDHLFSRATLLTLMLLSVPITAHAGFLSPGPSPSPTPSPGMPGAGVDGLPPMQYWGGPVVEQVKVYAVFWGPSVNLETQERIGGFFRAITDSTYFDFLDSEYNTFFFDQNGHIGTFQDINRGTYMGATTIFPLNTKPVLNDLAPNYDVTTEINYQISIGVLPPSDKNTLYVIFLPPGVDSNAGFGSACTG